MVRLSIFLLFHFFVLVSTVGGATASGAIVELQGETVSLKAEQVPLRTILHLLQEQGVAVLRTDPHAPV